ncbi:hypothetical protein AVEN_20878-1 [Araneus ventricosus]|uniref:Uncharacterized protein n=1 Tax=Araneus ventricosus TaxID=182803 RepID=A0A4Y2KJJ4_ARAVE|nr:hypothetical protein AVEN_20878-1 [Araneus ventricosus]
MISPKIYCVCGLCIFTFSILNDHKCPLKKRMKQGHYDCFHPGLFMKSQHRNKRMAPLRHDFTEDMLCLLAVHIHFLNPERPLIPTQEKNGGSPKSSNTPAKFEPSFVKCNFLNI